MQEWLTPTGVALAITWGLLLHMVITLYQILAALRKNKP